MPPETEVVQAPAAPAPDTTEVSISDYRKARSEGKEVVADVTETPADGADKGVVKTAPVTESGQSKDEEEGEEEAGTGPKPKGGFQRKIDKLTRERSELERTNAELREVNTRLQALETKNPEVKVEAKADGDPKPDKTKFTDYDEYAVALSRWVTRQELKANQESQVKTQRDQAESDRKAQTKQQFDKYVGEMRAVKDSKPDYDAVFQETQFPDYIHNRLVRMDKGAEIAYELAKNKEVLKKILDLNAEGLRRGDNDFSDAYWEFGAFVRSLQKTSSPEKKIDKPVSSAPAPITPVGQGAGPAEIDLDKGDISIADYRRMRASGKIR